MSSNGKHRGRTLLPGSEEVERKLLTSKVIETAWNGVKENIPSDTHPLQVKTYKRFFFAGAKALMDNLVYTDTLDESTDEGTVDDTKRLDAIMHEITEFFAGVVAGRN